MTQAQKREALAARIYAVIGYLASSIGIGVIDVFVLPEEFADRFAMLARVGWGACLCGGGMIAAWSALRGSWQAERTASLSILAPLLTYGCLIVVWAFEGSHRGAQWPSAVLIVSVSAFLMLRRHYLVVSNVDPLVLERRRR